MSAGQIDALYIDNVQNYYIIDFKRVAKDKKLCPKDKGWALRGEDPLCGLGPMAHLPDTHYQKYSLQTSIYNRSCCMTHTCGIDVGEHMYLLCMHEDRAKYELVQCRDLRSEAREALKSEQERLEVQGPPPPPAASPAAPMDTGAAPPPQSAAAVHKRPRGPAPKGKEWDEGKGTWAKPSQRPRGPATPVTDLTLKARPGGKALKGKKWDAEAGSWVSSDRGCCKRKACAPAPPVDENVAPQPRRRAGLSTEMYQVTQVMREFRCGQTT